MRRVQTIDGLPVYDAEAPLLIEVLPVDISQRRRKDPEHCAIAEACKRGLHCTEARVYLSRLYIRRGNHWERYQLNEAVRSEIQTFDRGGGFSTGTYRVAPVPPSQRAGAQHSGKKTNTGMGRAITQRNVTGIRQHSPLAGGAIEQGTK